MQFDPGVIVVTLYFLSPLAIVICKWLGKKKELRDEELDNMCLDTKQRVPLFLGKAEEEVKHHPLPDWPRVLKLLEHSEVAHSFNAQEKLAFAARREEVLRKLYSRRGDGFSNHPAVQSAMRYYEIIVETHAEFAEILRQAIASAAAEAEHHAWRAELYDQD